MSGLKEAKRSKGPADLLKKRVLFTSKKGVKLVGLGKSGEEEGSSLLARLLVDAFAKSAEALPAPRCRDEKSLG